MFKIVAIRQYTVKPDIPGFNKAMFNEMVRLWKGAIDAFVDELINGGKIHLDTGMSRASVIPLAREFRLGKLAAATIHGRRGPRIGYTDISGTWHKRGMKSPETGERLGRKPKGYTVSVGTPGRLNFNFRFRIMVYQWAYYEAEWGALTAARSAFINYVNKNKKEALRSSLRKLFKPTVGGTL